MKEASAQFHVAKMNKNAHSAFTELYDTEEFQATDSFQRQMFLGVAYIDSDGLMVPFNKIECQKSLLRSTINERGRRDKSWPINMS
jgi:hypothetical protein